MEPAAEFVLRNCAQLADLAASQHQGKIRPVFRPSLRWTAACARRMGVHVSSC